MIKTEENYQNFKEPSKALQIQGVCVLEINSGGKIEIVFQRGIDVLLVQKILKLTKNRIINDEQGISEDYIGNYNAYLVYCSMSPRNRLVTIFIDKKENELKYPKLDYFSKVLFEKIGVNTINLEFKKIYINTAGIPRAKGLVGFLVLDRTGLLYFSKVQKMRKSMAKNVFQIAGFISAMLIYSEDLISGEDPEVRLEDINLGSHHFYVNIKKNVIFAYFTEKDKTTENFDKNIRVVVNKFINKYYNPYITKFRGDLSPFHSFERILDQYFEI
ncbi:MAG: hypothetical protein ACXABO_19825 [Promethearchaeota archaeon]|jgi:hypothetical protein